MIIFAVFGFSLMALGGISFVSAVLSYANSNSLEGDAGIIVVIVSLIILTTGFVLCCIMSVVEHKNRQEQNEETIIPKTNLIITAILSIFLGGSGLIIIFLSYRGGMFETINEEVIRFIVFFGTALMTGIFSSIIMLIITQKDKINAKNKDVSK